jgi:hypothetical protein
MTGVNSEEERQTRLCNGITSERSIIAGKKKQERGKNKIEPKRRPLRQFGDRKKKIVLP